MDLALQKTTQSGQQHLKRKRISNQSICSNPEERLTHEVECIKRENEAQKGMYRKLELRSSTEDLSPRGSYLK